MSAICGGRRPVRECYGGCHEWCMAPNWCGTPIEDLTPKTRRAIARYQASSGGCYVNDLREGKHWNLSERMKSLLLNRTYLDVPQTDRTGRALRSRGLMDWWEPIDDNWFRAHWHLYGEGRCAATALRRERDIPEPEWIPCLCAGGLR